MQVLVTGAAGFIGAALVRALAAREDVDAIVATDQAAPPVSSPKTRAIVGNLAYPKFARSLVTSDTAVVYHLASLVSGGAEQNFELGAKVNLEATRDLLEACRLAGTAPKFVFASSIAVYAAEPPAALPDPVTDDTPAAPVLSYGAHKLVGEILIDDYTRRGYLDGRSLRLPTVMVRPGGANTAVSGWASAIVREPLAGRDYVCPVREDTRMACLSLGRVVESFLHAASLEGGALGRRRTVLLSGIPVSAGEMWEAVRRRAGRRARMGEVRFAPEPRIQAIMDAVPKATFSARAAALGFRPSASIGEIVDEYEETHSDPALARHG